MLKKNMKPFITICATNIYEFRRVLKYVVMLESLEYSSLSAAIDAFGIPRELVGC